jgi:Rrf2 family protein
MEDGLVVSSRFTVAVHILALLAHEDGRALTSDYIAGSVNTNPVVIRRVLGLLARAGLVASVEGKGGGTTLQRRASKISLAEVFRAVEAADLFALPPNAPNPLCPVGRSVQQVLSGQLELFEAALEKSMSKVSIADVLAGIQTVNRR